MSESQSTAPKKIALLICDTPMPSVLGEHGDYHVIFTDLLRASGQQLNIGDIATKCELVPFDVVHKMEYPESAELDSYAGILITGSKASAHELDTIDWIKKLVNWVAHVATEKSALKIVGICFGHQIVALALGGRCVKNDGKWEVGPTKISLTDIGQEIFGVKESLNIQEMHQDHVPEVLPNFRLLGSTDVALNQGMVKFNSDAAPASPISLSDIHVLTIQGHPEFTQPIMDKMVEARAAQGIIPTATAKQAEARTNWQNDGVGVVGKAILGVYGISPM